MINAMKKKTNLADRLNEGEGFIAETKYDFLGFSIYDILHIVFAIVFLVVAFIKREGFCEMEVGESFVEIVFSILLIAFILEMVKKHHEAATTRRFYTFAWLSACAALLVPESFGIPHLVSSVIDDGVFIHHEILRLIEISFSLISFVLFLLSLKKADSGKGWTPSILMAMIFFVLTVPLAITRLFLANEHEPILLVCYVIKDLAPVAPFAFALYGLIKEMKQNKKKENGEGEQ